MGLNDHVILETFLHDKFPNAFAAAPPVGFCADAVLIDMTAALRAAFSSTRNETGADMARHILNRVRHHCQAQRCDGPTEAHTADDTKKLLELRKDNREMFCCPVSDSASFVLAMDNSDFTPGIRDLLHKKRYSRIKPLTADDFEADSSGVGSAYIYGDRPLPGVTCGDDQKRLNLIRNRAFCTPAVRAAVNTYIPWLTASMVAGRWPKGLCCRRHEEEDPCAHQMRHQMRVHEQHSRADDYAAKYVVRTSRQTGDHEDPIAQEYLENLTELLSTTEVTDMENYLQTHKFPADCGRAELTRGRTLTLDALYPNFDCNAFIQDPLHKADPTTWKDGNAKCVTIELETGRIARSEEVPSLGECDLKIPYYIHKLFPPPPTATTESSVGSNGGNDEKPHVLVRCSDSDLLWILLINADHYAHLGSLILDMDTANMMERRLPRRFVDILKLRSNIIEYAARNWGIHDGRKAVVALAGLALCLGGDYVDRFPKVGPKKIVQVIEERMMDLYADKYVDVSDLDGISVALFKNEFALRATTELYFKCANAKAQRAIVNAGDSHRTDFQFVMRNLHAMNCTFVESANKAIAHWRRIAWNITYYMNAHLAIGCLPSPAVSVWPDDNETKKPVCSVWGWISEDGNYVKMDSVLDDLDVLKMFVENEARSRTKTSKRKRKIEINSICI